MFARDAVVGCVHHIHVAYDDVVGIVVAAIFAVDMFVVVYTTGAQAAASPRFPKVYVSTEVDAGSTVALGSINSSWRFSLSSFRGRRLPIVC